MINMVIICAVLGAVVYFLIRELSKKEEVNPGPKPVDEDKLWDDLLKELQVLQPELFHRTIKILKLRDPMELVRMIHGDAKCPHWVGYAFDNNFIRVAAIRALHPSQVNPLPKGEDLTEEEYWEKKKAGEDVDGKTTEPTEADKWDKWSKWLYIGKRNPTSATVEIPGPGGKETPILNLLLDWKEHGVEYVEMYSGTLPTKYPIESCITMFQDEVDLS